MWFQIISAGISIAQGIAQGIGAHRAAAAARREGRRLSRDAIARGEEEVRRYGFDLGQLIGRQRTAIGAGQGIDLTQGTAATLQQQAKDFGLEDVETIRLNAAREARGYRSAARQQSNQLKTQAVFSFLNAGVDAWSVYQQGQRLGTTAATAKAKGVKSKLRAGPSHSAAPPVVPSFRPNVGRAPVRSLNSVSRYPATGLRRP
ncbi:MAG TPA: hypothetical protein VM285_03705 [Polyangia bacterium]|nr:hypothetical protein [Polyangia bacterium]